MKLKDLINEKNELDNIQGYVATIKRDNMIKYLRFSGGLTKNFDDAIVFKTPGEAYAAANKIKDDGDLAGSRAIGNDAKEIKY